jgi:glycosyltransferase involved in cell wall biosynthesis
MPENPSVSLVIPVFNEEASLDELIVRCLEVGRKIVRPFEIILVDDGSSDASARPRYFVEQIVGKSAVRDEQAHACHQVTA